MALSSTLSPMVLVVEDEPLLRMHAVDLVEEAGCRAVEAGNADEAYAILLARADIRVVFTDIDMPGSMDGLKLAVLIRERWPPIELIIASGHLSPRDHEVPVRGRFFAKPFDDRQIVEALQHFAHK